MKKLLLPLLFLLVVPFAMAQKKFEGRITYSFSLEGEGAESMAAFMPRTMSIDVLKSESSIVMSGGLMDLMLGRVFTVSKKNKSYMIKDNEKVAYEMSMDQNTPTSENNTITKEDETIIIQGYTCQKYKVVSTGPEGESISYVWTTQELVLPQTMSNKSAASSMLSGKGTPGTPLKVMTSQGGMTITVTATQISKNKPSKDLFKIPKGYSIEPFKF